VRDAAATIPREVTARFETAKKLSDEDKKNLIEIARKALLPFQPKPEAKTATKVEPKPEDKAKTGAEPKPQEKAKVETKAKGESPPPVGRKPSPEVDSDTKP
jgi:F-type H+-transporting ATPase subunit alpha